MKLMEDWKRVARKAWSIRLMLLAGILTACEAVLPLFSTSIPQGLFVGLNLVVIPAAMIARITTQKGLD